MKAFNKAINHAVIFFQYTLVTLIIIIKLKMISPINLVHLIRNFISIAAIWHVNIYCAIAGVSTLNAANLIRI